MISCTEFIPVYSELFAFIEEMGGREAIERFWAEHADRVLDGTLTRLAAEKGVAGCWEYWRRTLAEESSDARLTYDPKADVFTIEMRACPSKGRLLAFRKGEDFTPYPAYCDHCPALYARVLAPYGLSFTMDLSDCDRARCTATVRRMPE